MPSTVYDASNKNLGIKLPFLRSSLNRLTRKQVCSRCYRAASEASQQPRLVDVSLGGRLTTSAAQPGQPSGADAGNPD